MKLFTKLRRSKYEIRIDISISASSETGSYINVQPSAPRSCARQRDRPNADATIEEWYKINVTIPFLDHVIAELKAQFSPLAKTASKLLKIVPTYLCGKDGSVDIEDIYLSCTQMTYHHQSFLSKK